MSDATLVITRSVSVSLSEIEWTAIRAQGAGGQHVNTTSSAVQLRFDIPASSLPDAVKQRLLDRPDRRLSQDGVLIIKAQTERSQERNRQHALERLRLILEAATRVPRVRKATRPSANARRKRVDEKTRRGRTKRLRSSTDD
ncbi:alternative ribosome rescue aminoacyl-tRNA hydrolase ArfB [Algiphilus sp. W345]|uniref:Alternative ribosome rescue aminoacyl-tRNA hydrolase ArfB n=1 Tax=Banduia mediterranea TaxID=3075609 RepID=A0ABU2WGC4_9GAMM|nr:alternative ribosome rescue aminoacyl-tRNA hydrolase ArfB [Algiphilus sp. W345]MDT0496923.1 alternative ribosome rescue aminoacyl-tRNA hydrolase ArfB [Algiphilus sp. W345]